MNQPFSLDAQDSKPLVFTVWLLADRRKEAVLLLMFAFAVTVAVWCGTQNVFFSLTAAAGLGLSLWHLFIPVHYEINADGILRDVLGFRRLIIWNQIGVYRAREGGIFFLPLNDRFYLEAFRGFFLPVPPSLSVEVLHRFRTNIGIEE